MFHALVPAALSSCGDARTQLQNAQTLLTRAQSMIDAKEPGAAAPYEQATELLQGLAVSTEAGCDTNGYAMAVLASQMRALLVATEVNEMHPLEAYGRALSLDANYDESHVAASGVRTTLGDIVGRLMSAHNPASNACEISDIAVETNEVVTPDYPDVARDAISEATIVVVNVRVDRDGRASKTSVAKSSGNSSLDAAASAAAAATTYLPAVKGCVRVPSSYLFHVTFDPNG